MNTVRSNPRTFLAFLAVPQGEKGKPFLAFLAGPQGGRGAEGWKKTKRVKRGKLLFIDYSNETWNSPERTGMYSFSPHPPARKARKVGLIRRLLTFLALSSREVERIQREFEHMEAVLRQQKGSDPMTRTKTFQAQLKAQPDMKVSCLFSVFNTVDQSNEVVLPSFFTDGQEVPMAAWGHNWNELPVGKGVIRVTDEGAVFDGQFFDTAGGIEHYETIKSMDGLQEWSWGFRVHEAYQGDFQGQQVTFLAKGDVFEVSPVLIGDNRETRTLHIKGLGIVPALREIPADEVVAPRVMLAQRARVFAAKELGLVPPRIRWWTRITDDDIHEAVQAKRWPWPVKADDDVWGWYSPRDTGSISLRSALSGPDLVDTVIHEVYHKWQDRQGGFRVLDDEEIEADAQAYADELTFEFFKDARRSGEYLPEDDGRTFHSNGVWLLKRGELVTADGSISYRNGTHVSANGTTRYPDGSMFRPALIGAW